MNAIADYRLPAPAKARLETFGRVSYLHTSGIAYPAISGHPDIFFCQTKDGVVSALRSPDKVLDRIKLEGVSIISSNSPIGNKYPETAILNAVVTDKHLIHNEIYTDANLKRSCSHLDSVHVKQAYTRCNLIALSDDRFITSDRGIEKTLNKQGFDIMYVDPRGIILPGHNNGFIGGTCGLLGRKIFFIGSLDHFHDGQRIRDFLKDYEIIELYEGALFDGGSLLFLK